MSNFDPYYQWLSIPPNDQPPDHYRLLGLCRFEANPAVIEGAADRQMAHLRSVQSGQHGHFSQQLLNEVSAARICLLDPERRATYDTELRQATEFTAKPVVSDDALDELATQATLLDKTLVTSPFNQSAKRRSPNRPQWIVPLLIGSGAVLMLLVGVLVTSRIRLRNRDVAAAPAVLRDDPQENENRETAASSDPSTHQPTRDVVPIDGAPAKKTRLDSDPSQTAADGAEINGRFHAVVKGELHLYKNGQPVKFANSVTLEGAGRSAPTSLRVGDILVLEFRSRWVNRALRIAYVSPNGQVLSFQRKHFKHVDALDIEQVDAAAINVRRRVARKGRVDDGHRRMWARFALNDDGEWMWGAKKNKWEKIACVIVPAMSDTLR